MPKALNSCPKSKKSLNLVTLTPPQKLPKTLTFSKIWSHCSKPSKAHLQELLFGWLELLDLLDEDSKEVVGLVHPANVLETDLGQDGHVLGDGEQLVGQVPLNFFAITDLTLNCDLKPMSCRIATLHRNKAL